MISTLTSLQMNVITHVGIQNPFILSESKGHKNLEIILDSLNLHGIFSFKTTLNSGKTVFVNTKSVYISGEKHF